MGRLFLIFFFLYLLVFSVFAQEKSNNLQSNSPEIKETTKFDEFGDIGEKEFAPRLKKYLEALMKNESLQGHLIFYEGFNDSLFRQTSYFEKGKMRSYFKYLFTCFGPRITVIRGGFREKMAVELWITPLNGKYPEPESSEYRPPENLSYQLELLGTQTLDFKDAKVKKEVEEDIKEEKKLRKETDFHEILSDVLSKDISWRAVLIFYTDDTEFDVKIIRENIVKLLKAKKVDLNRVKLIYGGYRQDTEIESWIVPKNGIEPEAMPDEKIEEK